MRVINYAVVGGYGMCTYPPPRGGAQQDPSLMRRVVWAIAWLGLFAGGCREQQEAEVPEQLDAEDYGALPSLKLTPDQKLRDELARITEEGGTPELLSKARIAEEDNVAAGLAGLLPDTAIDAVLKGSEKIFPAGKFQFDPIRLQRTINFRRRYDAQRLQARRALGRPQCEFGIRFTAGLQAQWKFIDVVRICARLEAFAAAESLADHRLDEAIESLGLMLRWASCLGAEKLPMARLEAAFLRAEAFRVLQAIVEDERIARKHLDRLYEMVEGQLTTWPDDAHAWIGDRALGLHAYEMVRAGHLRDLLSQEEIEQFQAEDLLQEVLAAAMRNVNHDELYYLQTMRKIIASCSQPYHARRSLFDSIGSDLQENRSSPEFPFVAVWVLLLPEVRKGHAIQAQDRANWEAWALALALASGRAMPAYRINPLTAEEYRYEKYDRTIEVTNFGSGRGGDNPSIVVPDLSGGDEPR
jgi:hypothetical protein